MNLRRHPPERRRRSVTLAAHGCCCCCCCCLHSLGGLIGAAVGGVKAITPEARRTVKIYWLAFLGAVVTGLPSLNAWMNEGFGVALVLAAIFLPVGQFFASFVTLCVNMFTPIDLPTLGRITWKGFLWAVIGFVVMMVPLILMAR